EQHTRCCKGCACDRPKIPIGKGAAAKKEVDHIQTEQRAERHQKRLAGARCADRVAQSQRAREPCERRKREDSRKKPERLDRTDCKSCRPEKAEEIEKPTQAPKGAEPLGGQDFESGEGRCDHARPCVALALTRNARSRRACYGKQPKGNVDGRNLLQQSA